MCFTLLARLFQSGKTSLLSPDLLFSFHYMHWQFCFCSGAGNRWRWPVVPTWRRCQALNGILKIISIPNVGWTLLYIHCLFTFISSIKQYLISFMFCLTVPNISLSVLKPHFLEILLESHIVMIRVRNNKKICFYPSVLEECVLSDMICTDINMHFLLLLFVFRVTVAWSPKTMRWTQNRGTGPSTTRYTNWSVV